MARQLAVQLVDSVATLTALTALALKAAVALPPVQQLTHLTGLRELRLHAFNEQASVAPLPQPAAFPLLESCAFICENCLFSSQVPGRGCCSLGL